MIKDSNNRVLSLGDYVSSPTFKGVGVITCLSEDKGSFDVRVLVGKNEIVLSSKESTIEFVPSMKSLAQSALDVQDACNLIAVVNSFARVIKHVRVHEESKSGYSSDALHNHPVIQLYADKIASLTSMQSGEGFSKAYGRA